MTDLQREDLSVGLRVVRGPGWSYGDQDGGEGCVGTVAALGEPGVRGVVVQWDAGKRCRYSCGADGRYELRVLDSAPTGLVHPFTACTWCNEEPIRGMVWKCVSCHDYQLCTPCYFAGKHSVDHAFERISGTDSEQRVRVDRRYLAEGQVARGVWPGATVVRGWDWQWEEQDGGRGHLGTTLTVEDWGEESARSVVSVQWTDTRFKNIYRLGHKGKSDVKCTAAANGLFHYPSHLPLLGMPLRYPPAMQLSAGDAVKVQMDPDVFKTAQDGHGGWNDKMAEFIGRVGVVASLQDEGDVVVRYSNNKVFLLSPTTLTKVDIPVYCYGDVVRVLEDMQQVCALQRGHGNWNDDMALALGQLGRVVKLRSDDNVKVAVNGRRWIMNPLCLCPAPGATPLEEEEGTEVFEGDVSSRLHLLSLAQAGCPDVVGMAAQAGCLSLLRDYLQKNPHEVNTRVQGRVPLHLAIVEGHQHVVELLLQYRPNLKLEDDSGETALHVCAYLNNGRAALLLVGEGADINTKDSTGATPVSVSAALGHYSVLEVLLSQPQTVVNTQDAAGKTPLHCAVFAQRRRAVRMLLERGADPTLCDHSMKIALLNCAGFGFVAGIEELLRYAPSFVNLQKEDGYTALHVAAASNHCSAVSFLASHPACNLNAREELRLTPLHIAVYEGHVTVVERLVGFGADLNAASSDGSTPLHFALRKNNMAAPNRDSPMILQTRSELDGAHGKGTLSTNLVVAVFLVQQGADLHIKNHSAVSPLQILPADLSSVVLGYRGQSSSLFHRSLRKLICPFDGSAKRAKEPAVGGLSSARGEGRPGPDRAQAGRQPDLGVERPKQQHNMASPLPITAGGSGGGYIAPMEKDYPKTEANISNNRTPAASLHSLAKELFPCFLCEKPADVKFLPCADIVMCHDCVLRVKKCPHCRQTVDKSVPVCVFCKSQRVIHTQAPCNHTYCKDCISSEGHCRACQSLAEDT